MARSMLQASSSIIDAPLDNPPFLDRRHPDHDLGRISTGLAYFRRFFRSHGCRRMLRAEGLGRRTGERGLRVGVSKDGGRVLEWRRRLSRLSTVPGEFIAGC